MTEPCPDAEPFISDRLSRAEGFGNAYGVCAELVPGRPGSCRLTIRGLDKCRRTRAADFLRSWKTFSTQVRKLEDCERATKVEARKLRRQCLRKRDCPCPSSIATTT